MSQVDKGSNIEFLFIYLFLSMLTMEEFEVQKQGPFFSEYVSEALPKIEVLAEKVMNQRGDVSNNKLPGTDGFCPRALRELECEIVKLQTMVYDTDSVSEDWKVAKTMPIF